MDGLNVLLAGMALAAVAPLAQATGVAAKDAVAPALRISAPENRAEVPRRFLLQGECDVGLPVHYYAKGQASLQSGQFPCTSTPFAQQLSLEHPGPTNFYLKQQDAAGNKTWRSVWLKVLESAVPELPEDASSGGSIAINGMRVSRRSCVSPCTVMFSLDRLTDPSAQNPFTDSGVYWHYDDDDADERLGRFTHGADYFRHGRAEQSGASRESDTNTPIGMHTYTCDTGTCEYRPGVAVRNAQGDWATEWTTLTVQATDAAFSGAATVCISTAGEFDGDSPCPAGAGRQTHIPGPNAWRSHTRYLLRRGEQYAASCIAYGHQRILISDFGDAADPLPEIARLGLGHDGRCSDTIPTDARIAAYPDGIWLEDATISHVRVPYIDVGMSFRNIDLHGVDMDYSEQAGGGEIRLVSADACSRRADLSCANVPLPVGFYVSESTIKGDERQPPGLNIGFLSAGCVSFFGLLDLEIETAFEHNVRLECASRVLAMHSDLNGNHVGDRGNKAALTVRPEGYLDQDMLEAGYKVDTSPGRAQVYDNRYIVAKDLYLGTPDSINNAARISFSATRRDQPEATRYGLVSNNIADLIGGAGSGPAHFDTAFQGLGLVCYDDNDWSPGGAGCGDYPQGALPGPFFEPSRLDAAVPLIPLSPHGYPD